MLGKRSYSQFSRGVRPSGLRRTATAGGRQALNVGFRNPRQSYRLGRTQAARIAALERSAGNTAKVHQVRDETQTGIRQQAPYSFLLNGITQGDGAGDRTGNRICLRKGAITMQMRTDHSSTEASIRPNHSYRVMVVYDKLARGTAHNPINSIFGTTTPFVYSQYELQAKAPYHDFRILHDKVYTVPVQQAVWDETGQVVIQGDIYQVLNVNWNLKDAMTIYNATGTAASRIEDGAMYLIVISDCGLNESHSVNYDARQVFTD